MDNVATILDTDGLPVGTPRPVRIVEYTCDVSDSAVHSLLDWCCDLPDSSIREELIDALSIRLLLSALRVDPADPQTVRYLDLGCDGDGGSICRVVLGNGVEIGDWLEEFDDSDDAVDAARNLDSPLRVTGADHLLDLHQFRNAVHTWRLPDGVEQVFGYDATGVDLACSRVVRALIFGDGREPSEHDWNTAAMLGCLPEDVSDNLDHATEITVGHLRITLRDRIRTSIHRRHALDQVTRWESTYWHRESLPLPRA